MLMLTGSVSHSSVEMTEDEVEVSLSLCVLSITSPDVANICSHTERVYPVCTGVSLRPVHADPAAAGGAARPRRRRGESAERTATHQRDAAGTLLRVEGALWERCEGVVGAYGSILRGLQERCENV